MSAVQQILLTGGSQVTVSIDDAYAFNGLYGAATYQLNPDGNIYVSPFGLQSPWISKATASSLYEARMTLINGFLTSTGAPLNTWLNLGTTREWAFSALASSGTADCSLEIRRASTPDTILDAATITFEYLGSFE
jgi:hypothetical protein